MNRRTIPAGIGALIALAAVLQGGAAHAATMYPGGGHGFPNCQIAPANPLCPRGASGHDLMHHGPGPGAAR